MDDNYTMNEIIFNAKKSKNRKSSLFNELSSIEENDEPVLASSLYSYSKAKEKEKDKEKKQKEKEKLKIHTPSYGDNSSDVDDDWLDTLSSFKIPKSSKKKKNKFYGFDIEGKKGKKKKKKDGELVNHKKDFEPEMLLLRNLQMEQNKFVDSLQKKYDQLENTKSTARGVGKYTTDLIMSITSARSLSMQLVDKIISTKKTVADLDFKERKEFGSGNSSEQQNLTNYASTYLKQVMSTGRNNLINSGVNDSYYSGGDVDGDVDDLFDSIDESLGETNRSEDVEKYLKYENDGVEIRVVWKDDADENSDNKYEFYAINNEGKLVDDYPLPEKTKLNINRTTQTATDIYGNKYKMEVV